MPDEFARFNVSLTSPLVNGFAVTPDDSVDLQEVTRALYVGTGGDVAVELAGGASLVLKDMQGGSLYPIRVNRVLATNTTAAELVGLV
ncbi:hypothetical protein RGUI_4208 (plasmid) [Rhodovulum sp. P5]|uniref:spike base protein, RCAP_Rcc01079 family n=1 Tax=Rhodovulum sp. P5 TaxID=1564506 RepID=UPI0009C373DC|nr:hypothetical protein [Rhodovulum sp. P5]ARE42525.1 hypothetical protein RGUI_4208 [Rhodovulum sp. P5]